MSTKWFLATRGLFNLIHAAHKGQLWFKAPNNRPGGSFLIFDNKWTVGLSRRALGEAHDATEIIY